MVERGRDIATRWLLFDAECGFCQRWCAWAKRRGAEPAIIFQACQPAVDLRAKANISEADCGQAAFLVECDSSGAVVKVRRAAAAINGVLRHLPGGRNSLWRLASFLYAVPGLRQIEELGYRLVARWRGHLGGHGGSCKIR